MSTTKIQFGAAAIGKKIYVSGGDSETQKLNLFEVYDIENQSWNELSSMPTARDCHGMEALNGNIYVTGGYDSSSNRLKSVLKYSPQTNTWTEMKEMNEARGNHQLVSFHGSIYAIGGDNSKSVERYSPLVNQWSYVTSTRYTYGQAGTAVHQNKIYVLGNEGFEVFHPESDTWQELPALNIGSGLQLASVNGRLLALGVGEGIHKNTGSKTVYEFNTANNSWIHLKDMDVARYLYRAVVVNA